MSNIQISCYPVNHFEEVPLSVDIEFHDFRFERVIDCVGNKSNVFAILWTQNNQPSEFFIAIENAIQFKNYESYLNNVMKICRIAEMGKHFTKLSYFLCNLSIQRFHMVFMEKTKPELRNKIINHIE